MIQKKHLYFEYLKTIYSCISALDERTMLRSMWIKIPMLVAALLAFLWLDGIAAVVAGCAILLGGSALLLIITMHPNASVWAKTLWRAPQETSLVALTFDDGPDPKATPKILEILAEQKISAAFFVVGQRARAHPELIERLHREGHLICNHSDTHPMDFHFRLWSTHRQEIQACNETIASAIGQEPTLFRSPQGIKNPALGDVLRELDMTAVGWQVRGLDSISGDAHAIERRIVGGAKAGGVILLHDGGGFGGRPNRDPTIEALPRLIEGLQARGLAFARLDELLKCKPYRAA